MSSSIFFKFKSQKEPSQITFDGTSLSVFEVKRDIIALSKLGDGTDFDLEINTSDTNEREYMSAVKLLETMLMHKQVTMMTPFKFHARRLSSLVGFPRPNQVQVEPHDMSRARCQSTLRTNIASRRLAQTPARELQLHRVFPRMASP